MKNAGILHWNGSGLLTVGNSYFGGYSSDYTLNRTLYLRKILAGVSISTGAGVNGLNIPVTSMTINLFGNSPYTQFDLQSPVIPTGSGFGANNTFAVVKSSLGFIDVDFLEGNVLLNSGEFGFNLEFMINAALPVAGVYAADLHLFFSEP